MGKSRMILKLLLKRTIYICQLMRMVTSFEFHSYLISTWVFNTTYIIPNVPWNYSYFTQVTIYDAPTYLNSYFNLIFEMLSLLYLWVRSSGITNLSCHLKTLCVSPVHLASLSWHVWTTKWYTHTHTLSLSLLTVNLSLRRLC